MDTYFTIVIDNRKLDFISMNVTGPKLFQVFTEVDGRQLRFHMHGNGVDVLEFAMPEECPQFLLAMEKKIAEQIFNRYQPVQSTSTADNI